jgi:ADP-ribose pyrophosphatase YjhB (NUDIX family)
MHTYEHPHPAVTVDAVLFTERAGVLHVLLIRRGHEPFKGSWALPGGFVDIDEDLDDAVRRELREETGIDGVPLTQFHTFGAPDRDPRERIITVAYHGCVAAEEVEPRAGTDAADARWFPVAALPALAADHDEIIARARDAARAAPKQTDPA